MNLFKGIELALTTQQWTLILLAICVLPIAVLIILAIIFRIKNSVKRSKGHEETLGDDSQRKEFIDAFGGEDNYIDASIERIKVIVKLRDPELVNGERLQELGAKGVLIVGNEVRCSFGDRAEYVYKTLTSKAPALEEEVKNEEPENE